MPVLSLPRRWTVAVPPAFDGLMRGCAHSALHLEMRDTYKRSDRAFADWQAGRRFDPAERWPRWIQLVQEVTRRGVQVRRARVVCEPVNDYTRFVYEITTGLNIRAGEQVRWLPRRRATDLALPGNDFWLFDGSLVLVNHFGGDGDSLESELTEAPSVVKLCSAAFESVWDRAVPHAEYRPLLAGHHG